MKKILLSLILMCFVLITNAQIPAMPSSISGCVKMCPGDTCTYSVTPVAYATFYVWTMPTGASIINGDSTNIVTVLYNTNFNGGTMSVSAGNSSGIGQARTRTISFNLLLAPSAINGTVDGICNSNRLYTVTLLPGAISYQWSVGSAGMSIVGSNTQTLVEVNIANNFNSGNITVAGVNGCGVGSTKSLLLKGFPAQPSAITGEINVCMGGKYTYNIPTVAGSDYYSWVVPGISDIVGTTNTKSIQIGYCWVTAQNQTLSVRAVNSCGQSPVRTLTGIASSDCP